MSYVLYIYKVTDKCSHRLYYVIIVADYNLTLLIFLLLGMKSTQLVQDCNQLEYSMCLVIQ